MLHKLKVQKVSPCPRKNLSKNIARKLHDQSYARAGASVRAYGPMMIWLITAAVSHVQPPLMAQLRAHFT